MNRLIVSFDSFIRSFGWCWLVPINSGLTFRLARWVDEDLLSFPFHFWCYINITWFMLALEFNFMSMDHCFVYDDSKLTSVLASTIQTRAWFTSFYTKLPSTISVQRSRRTHNTTTEETKEKYWWMHAIMKSPNSPSDKSINKVDQRLVGLPRFSSLQWNNAGNFGWEALQEYNATISSRCEGSMPPKQFNENDEPPCSTCRYTGMAVCAGLSLYCWKLGMELKRNKPFYYGGALVWATAGIYRSMLDWKNKVL